MRRFIIASHGYYSKGIAEALKLIVGPYENLHVICAYVDEKQTEDILKEIQTILTRYPEDEFLIMTDLLGGSVNTECMQLLQTPGIHLVAGINLLFLLTVMTSSEAEAIEELISRAIEDARMGIVYCNAITQADGEDF